ncbi:MAG: glycosyltransferase family 1 protein [Flavobacterium sp.]|uniref:hypothetical protein n=1 Tax=Pedobacter agri TaxID=454586 RepID=UPI00121C3D75|nr:hypothetical protein [Pedobacter agri]MDQ1141880.1 hypothetical protein [Pedobacter agri]RZJ54666.1 MAG: glycosyltransferase family 1 protein [Flavobacterium sp.]
MIKNRVLNIFYEEPATDRWFKYDRYPRKMVRQLIRGKDKPGGVMMVALQLMKGLDKLGIPYRFNDYKHIKKHPEEIACIIGKPNVLFDRKWANPIIFGAGIYSHPIDCPDLLKLYPNIKLVLVPGEWMRSMFEPYYYDKVIAWPVGINHVEWSSKLKLRAKYDFLIYDKVRWEHEKFETELINPICKILEKHSLTYQFIKYGSYNINELKSKVGNSRAVIFLCEHETQGQAYQQILASNTPILAWDRGGYWQDPSYYPKILFKPVSSVPYWNRRCGEKFTNSSDFETQLLVFQDQFETYDPESYIEENLTLAHCAQKYLEIFDSVYSNL